MELIGMKKGQRTLAAACVFFVAALAIASSQEARRIEPAWEKALGGDASCPPVAFRGRVYVLSVDRALTCLDETGSFLWRKALKNRPAPRLMVSKNGLVCVFGRNGEMTAYGPNGGFLWTYSGMKGSLPVLNPYEGKDGRLFILYETEIVCLASNGTQKWKTRVNGSGAQMIGTDGRGNALIIKAGGDITPVSPYGTVFPSVKTGLDIRRAIPLAGSACAFFASEGSGYKISAVDFSLSENGKAASSFNILWECGGLPQIAAAIRYRGSLYCAGTNGSLFIFNAASGELLSQSQFNAQGAAAGASMFFEPNAEGGRVILLAQDFCIAFNKGGAPLWQVAFSKPLVNPVFTEGGYAVSAPQGSVVSGFFADASPKKKTRVEARSPRRDSYEIFAGKSLDYGNPDIVTFGYFEGVRKKIETGSIGKDEEDISRRLLEILNGDTGNPFLATRFDPAQRSLAAEFLGRLGSEAARAVLIDAARTETNPTVIAGILRGLAALGPENGRETFDAVMLIAQKNASRDEISLLVCDALSSIARSSYGEMSSEAVAAVYSYTSPQYSAATRKYALQIVEKLIE